MGVSGVAVPGVKMARMLFRLDLAGVGASGAGGAPCAWSANCTCGCSDLNVEVVQFEGGRFEGGVKIDRWGRTGAVLPSEGDCKGARGGFVGLAGSPGAGTVGGGGGAPKSRIRRFTTTV